MAKSLIGINVNQIETSLVLSGKVYHEQMPSNLVNNEGIISPMDSFAKYLKDLKKHGKIRGKDCAIVMPAGTTYFRTVNSPIISDEQVKLNLPFEFKNYIGADMAKYNYDYIVDGVENDENGKPVTMKLVAAAGLKFVTEEYAKVLKLAGYNLKLALPQEICLMNVMKNVAEKDKEYCLIGLGYDHTNVYMFNGSEIVASKAIEIGTKHIDELIASEMAVEEYIAADYREKNYNDCLNSDSAVEIYERIALEVMKVINFYKYEHNDTNLNSAYFFDLSSKNETMIFHICGQTGLSANDIKEILPDKYKNTEDAARYLANIGLTL